MKNVRDLSVWLYLAFTPTVLSAAVGRARHSKSYDMPLTWQPFGFTSQMSFGTPPQNITSVIDWTWNSQYLQSTLCMGSPTNTFNCLPPDQQFFNQTKSSTFKNITAQYPSQTWNPNHFFYNLDLKVDYASDVQIIGPSKATVRLQAGDLQFQQPFPVPFGGVFGLSPVFPEQKQSAQSTFWQAWQAGQFRRAHIAFHYCYPGSPDISKRTCNGNDAIQTLGGIDHNRFIHGTLEWYDVISFPIVNEIDFVYKPGFFDYWMVRLQSLSIGNTSQALNQTTGAAVVFDHASYGRGAALSANAYKNLIDLASAQPIKLASPPNNGAQELHAFDCAKTDTLPAIKYQFAGARKAWEIAPRNYVTKYEDGTCVLNIRTIGDGDFVIGNLGETFAMDKYIIMDFERLRVGVADVKW